MSILTTIQRAYAQDDFETIAYAVRAIVHTPDEEGDKALRWIANRSPEVMRKVVDAMEESK